MVVLPNILFIIRLHRMKFRLNGLIYTYDAGNALIRKDALGGNSSYFTYDCRGNCTAIQESEGTTYFTYNHANLVTDIRFKTGVCNYFWYDAQLRRYAMQDSDGLRYFTWDGLNLLVEQDDSGDVVAEYTHGASPIEGIGTMVAAKKEVDGATYFQYAAYDHRGTVVRLTDENGDVTDYYEYSAWGVPLQRQVSGVDSRWGYSSNWIDLKDSDGELVLSPARLYSAVDSRFLQRDMLGFVDSLNLYEAFGGNANKYVDPLGLQDDYWTIEGAIENLGQDYYNLTGEEALIITHAQAGYDYSLAVEGEIKKIIDLMQKKSKSTVITRLEDNAQGTGYISAGTRVESEAGEFDSSKELSGIPTFIHVGGNFTECLGRSWNSIANSRENSVRIVWPAKAIYQRGETSFWGYPTSMNLFDLLCCEKKTLEERQRVLKNALCVQLGWLIKGKSVNATIFLRVNLCGESYNLTINYKNCKAWGTPINRTINPANTTRHVNIFIDLVKGIRGD